MGNSAYPPFIRACIVRVGDSACMYINLTRRYLCTLYACVRYVRKMFVSPPFEEKSCCAQFKRIHKIAHQYQKCSDILMWIISTRKYATLEYHKMFMWIFRKIETFGIWFCKDSKRVTEWKLNRQSRRRKDGRS